jgi:hypothetical protein
MPVSGQVSYYPEETAIRIDCNQLGETQNTHPYKPGKGSCWVAFHPIRDTVGLIRTAKPRGHPEAKSLRQCLPRSILIPPHILAPIQRCNPARVTWLHDRNELSDRYVNGTFNLNQGPDNEAVLKWHRRDQEHRPSRPQQQYSNTGSRLVSSYPFITWFFSR